MRKFISAAVVAVATTALAAPAATADDAVPMIIGGGTASSAPWGAQVYVGGQFNCSGTIIAAEWVLTARHCSGSSMSVQVGNVNLGQGTESDVDKTATSPNGDILLLHLSTSIETTYMKLGSADPETGSRNSIYGWGRPKDNDPASPVLKTATVEVTGSSTDAFGGQAIASKGVDGAAWHGDSGGPQIAYGVQVGVCSTGENSGHDPNGTQNYASVAASRDFIKQTAGV
ncbi:trypsin-like serine protease [Kibdelosporangium lantanae]